MNLEQFTNQTAQTASLVSAISAIATSCLVSNPANFPILAAGQQFRMAMQDTPASPIELVLVTATSGPTLTIQRGVEGTAAISHISGAACAEVLTAYHAAASFPNGAQQTGASPYTFDGTQAIMEINALTPGASVVNIKTALLVPFKPYVIADGAGNAGTYHITLTPDAGNIGGVGQSSPASTFVLSVNAGSAKFYWNGTNCRLI